MTEGTCPRQSEATMAVQLAHRQYWRTNGWSTRRIWRDWLTDRKSKIFDWLKAHGLPVPRGRFYGGTCWPAGHPKPRTCSYCGGVHPDDAIALVLAGWEVEPTGKPYKRYLHPPGYADAVERLLKHQDELRTERFKWKGPHSPVPPVKVYVYHFDQQHIDAFNAALRSAKEQ